LILIPIIFPDIDSVNAKTTKHANPATKEYFDDIKPNPVANINIDPSNNGIIEIALIVCLLISAIPCQKILFLPVI
jgi:hypothetical protein